MCQKLNKKSLHLADTLPIREADLDHYTALKDHVHWIISLLLQLVQTTPIYCAYCHVQTCAVCVMHKLLTYA